MADRAGRLVAALLIAAAVSMAMPRAAWTIQAPGENCPEVPNPPPGCRQGGGGPNLGGLVPIVGAALGGAAIALGAAYVVVRRRTSGPVAPLDPTEWWTCASCGKNNVIGSPRCYACRSWRT